MFNNIWINIVQWFQDRSERNNLIYGFNKAANDAWVMGNVPTLLKASYSKGVSAYKHQFSAWFNSGFRIQALSGRALSKEEMVAIGDTILNNDMLVRRLVALGWDTLEVHDDTSNHGCRWKLIDYVNINFIG